MCITYKCNVKTNVNSYNKMFFDYAYFRHFDSAYNPIPTDQINTFESLL